MKFTPTKDFWSEETKSWYIGGMIYTVRTTKLDGFVKKWLQEGKVVPARVGASMQGVGEVKTSSFVERVKSWLSRIHF